MDREKVIKGLKCLITDEVPCNGCPYYGSGYCIKNIASDALALLKEQQQQIWEFQDQVEYLTDKLKEQEAVEPNRGLAKTQKAWFCGACGFRLNRAGRFCSKCGKPVKWE